jgi:hypothetical protein
MRLQEKTVVAIMVGCLMFLSGGCSSSILVDEWRDPSYNEPPLKKILVIDISTDLAKRQIWEDAFSVELSQFGVHAVSSYHIFPGVLPDTSRIVEAIQENAFDGVLVTRLLLPDTSSDYVEGSVTTLHKRRLNLRTGYYTYYEQYVQHPAHLDSQITKRRSIDLWVTGNEGRMIWNATSNTPEMRTLDAVRNAVAELVVPELARVGIINSRR